ncbi:MAG: phosphatase PAP2 family protein [Chthoniobacterales bacterium]
MSEPSARPRPFGRSRLFLRNRLSPESDFGLYFTIGVLVMILGAWCFSEIAEQIGPSTPVFALDRQVTNWFHEHARPELTALARVVTFCGSVGLVSAVSVCCALFFTARKAWNRLLAIIVTMLGGSLLNMLLKHFFHRQRPVLENPLVTLTSFGFPSGHTMGSTLLYGLLALIAARFIRKRWARLLIFAVAALFIALIGLTRIYLGAHYLTDVLGAVAVGCVWLAFSWTTVETLRRRRRINQAL